MSIALHGSTLSSGIAIGRARLISHAAHEVTRYDVPEKELIAEVRRFDQAIQTVQEELGHLKEQINLSSPVELSAFLEVHLMILADPMISQVPRDLIKDMRCNAEWALVKQMKLLVKQFSEIEDNYLKERQQDVVQVVERVLKAMLGLSRHIKMKEKGSEPAVIIAHDLSPADTVQLRQDNIAGFAISVGGVTSHTGIVARSLDLPALSSVAYVHEMVRENDLVIIDAQRGVLLIDPSPPIVHEYSLRRDAVLKEQEALLATKKAPSITQDAHSVILRSNIEFPQDVDKAQSVFSAGIGLYRTEFLFMNRAVLPSEDEQYQVYRHIAEKMQGHPVVIRTLDAGADKELMSAARPAQARSILNPALGLRAIRYCLAEPVLFLTQLRAILRASAHGDIRILIPMLSTVREIDQVLMMIWLAKDQMKSEKKLFNPEILIGGMIEVPAAALSITSFLKKFDFLSIGTNDLIQYTLAIDRGDDSVSYLYDPLHPAVLRLLHHVLLEASDANVPVSICGELSGDPKMTRLLIGLGARELSLHPSRLLEVKNIIRKTDCSTLDIAINNMLSSDDPAYIREEFDSLNSIDDQ